ncbi:hypothetical protein PSCLAVI8L_470001 [Pseudoclavibacter sp. 8L]|nr:hypothetical protein PSCLAVI8L_470001 [Pseudoclavibacter sp. 8L]
MATISQLWTAQQCGVSGEWRRGVGESDLSASIECCPPRPCACPPCRARPSTCPILRNPSAVPATLRRPGLTSGRFGPGMATTSQPWTAQQFGVSGQWRRAAGESELSASLECCLPRPPCRARPSTCPILRNPSAVPATLRGPGLTCGRFGPGMATISQLWAPEGGRGPRVCGGGVVEAQASAASRPSR